MLGKRFRRTTSMSHLGPGSSIPATALENATSHSVTHKAARPLLREACGADIMADDVSRDDVSITAVGMPGCALTQTQTQTQRPSSWLPSQTQAHTQTQRASWLVNDGDNGMGGPAGSVAPCASAIAGRKMMGFDFSDSMSVEGSQMVQSGHAGWMSNYEKHSQGSLVAYQMGLWIQSSMHASHGQGKLVEEQLQPKLPIISPVDFLDMCYYCKRRLAHERDIFIYRGDTAFCSEECRHRQIANDERRTSRAVANKQRGGARGRARSSTSETAVAA